MKMSSKIRN